MEEVWEEDPEETDEEEKQEERSYDYLAWIGGRYYTIESFIEEAKKIGVSKRVPYIPKFIPGKTRIFLVHDITKKDPNIIIRRVQQKKPDRKKWRTFRIKKKGPTTPYVFGYFIPTGILISCRAARTIAEHLKKKYNIVEVPFEKINNVERGCGYLKEGGMYLMDDKAFMEALKMVEEMKEIGFIKGGFTELNPWIPVPGLKRFRALKKIDGEKLLKEGKVVEVK